MNIMILFNLAKEKTINALQVADQDTSLRYRHELKYLCTTDDYILLKQKLPIVLHYDSHTNASHTYNVCSLYFDDYSNSCLGENIDGTSPREKWRIRLYNHDTSFIQLECKQKQYGMIHKDSTLIPLPLCQQLVFHPESLFPSDQYDPLLNRFLLLQRSRYFRPAVIVEYDRIPFVHPAGNVRVTIDSNIRSSNEYGHFLDQSITARPILPIGQHLLEVKYDEYIPDFIYHAIQGRNMTLCTFSKYYLCRKYHL